MSKKLALYIWLMLPILGSTFIACTQNGEIDESKVPLDAKEIKEIKKVMLDKNITAEQIKKRADEIQKKNPKIKDDPKKMKEAIDKELADVKSGKSTLITKNFNPYKRGAYGANGNSEKDNSGNTLNNGQDKTSNDLSTPFEAKNGIVHLPNGKIGQDLGILFGQKLTCSPTQFTLRDNASALDPNFYWWWTLRKEFNQ